MNLLHGKCGLHMKSRSVLVSLSIKDPVTKPRTLKLADEVPVSNS